MDPLAAPIAALHSETRLRVWSLVITVFGDVAMPRGGQMSATLLQQILGRLGVEYGAVRTALSRLTADGWLDRRREGRTSQYTLSKRGLAEFGPASALIYAPPDVDDPQDWTLGMGDPITGAIPLQGGYWLYPGALPAGAQPDLAVTGGLTGLTSTGRDRLFPTQLSTALDALHSDLGTLRRTELSAADAMAARVLLIHRWRRIVLRWPVLPNLLLHPRHADPGPRARVARTYAELLAPSEHWLDSVADWPDKTRPALAKRFGLRDWETAENGDPDNTHSVGAD